MKVGDLVVRNMGGLILKSMKGVILSIRQVSGATYYKIAWFDVDMISDQWQDGEFCLFSRDLPDNTGSIDWDRRVTRQYWHDRMKHPATNFFE